MTVEEKQRVFRFFNLAEDYTRDGYRRERETSLSADVPEAAALPGGDAVNTAPCAGDTLEGIVRDIAACTACPLHRTRTTTVSGEGASRPLALIIGEGPGADEDATGRPFVGRAGQLLDRMLASIGLYRDKNCFIANVVKCRPPNNRNPLPEEIAACALFLNRQIALLAPRAILCVGKVSTGTLLHTTEGIGRLRGSFAEYQDSAGRIIPLLPTYHPSALLRDESLKRPVWEDLKRFMTKLSELDESCAGGETKSRGSP
jgi:DNA polymerase